MTDNKQKILKLADEIIQKANVIQAMLGTDSSKVKSQVKPKVKKKLIRKVLGKPSSLIDDLINEGYFKKKRKPEEVQVRIKTSGFTIKLNPISVALLRKVKSKKLNRELTDEGYLYWAELEQSGKETK